MYTECMETKPYAIKGIYKDTFELIKNNGKIALFFIIAELVVYAAATFQTFDQSQIISVVVFILQVALACFFVYLLRKLFVSDDQRKGIQRTETTSLTKVTVRSLVGYLLLSILSVFSFFFFVVPGAYLIIPLALVIFVLVDRELSIMDGIKNAVALVYQRFWKIVWMFLCGMIPALVAVGLLLGGSLLLGMQLVTNTKSVGFEIAILIVAGILTALVYTFAFFYIFTVYKRLVAVRPNTPELLAKGTYWLKAFTIFAVIGFILMTSLIVVVSLRTAKERSTRSAMITQKMNDLKPHEAFGVQMLVPATFTEYGSDNGMIIFSCKCERTKTSQSPVIISRVYAGEAEEVSATEFIARMFSEAEAMMEGSDAESRVVVDVEKNIGEYVVQHKRIVFSSIKRNKEIYAEDWYAFLSADKSKAFILMFSSEKNDFAALTSHVDQILQSVKF